MATVQPHVVFLDMMMPGLSGLEALTYFRQHYRTVPVIVITGSIEQKVTRQPALAAPSTSAESPSTSMP